MLEDITKDSGLDFKIVDEGDQNTTTGEKELIPGESLTLTFRTFPFPWKLVVSHPGIKALENSARREIFFYGFLLAVIVALMLLGAVLIARDISRESETTRLKTEFDFRKGYLQDIIRDTLESYRYHLEKKGFIIHSDIVGDLPEIQFDGEAIASVLVNLLSNAMKFSLREKEVTIKLFRDNGNIILQVADKGIGISQKEIPKIFQRFYQAENKIASEAKGSGLGLTLVKNIVEDHKGRIQVESEPGKGSRFIVTIPLCEVSSLQSTVCSP